MTLSALAPFAQTASAWRETAEETARNLSAAELAIFPNLLNDATEVRAALFQAYPKEELSASLLAADVFGLDRHLLELHSDLFAGRYESAGRTLRFVWEMAFRAHLADSEQPDLTIDEKVVWLERQKPKPNWENCIAPPLPGLFPTNEPAEVTACFKTIWDRLNQVAHPTGPWRDSAVGESVRFAWPHFDADLCRRLLADVNEVMALVWLLVLHQFPKAQDTFANPACVFDSFPLLKGILGAESIPVMRSQFLSTTDIES